jgi:hypothetical protein
MKKNILAENMRRFGTKNLKEQSIIGNAVRVIGRPSIVDPSTSASGQRLYFNVDASLPEISALAKGGSEVVPGKGRLAGEIYLNGRWAIINQDGENVLPQSKQLMMFYDEQRHEIYCHIRAGTVSHALQVTKQIGLGDGLRAFQLTAVEALKLTRKSGLQIKTLNPAVQPNVEPATGISYGEDDNPANNQPKSQRYGQN